MFLITELVRCRALLNPGCFQPQRGFGLHQLVTAAQPSGLRGLQLPWGSGSVGLSLLLSSPSPPSPGPYQAARMKAPTLCERA